MPRPPAVAWDVRPVRWHAVLLVGLSLCACLLFLGFLVLQGWGTSSLALLVVLLVATLLAVRGLLKAPRGHINWDGAQWHWLGQEERAVTAVACVLNLQTRMLLRVACYPGTHQWLWPG